MERKKKDKTPNSQIAAKPNDTDDCDSGNSAEYDETSGEKEDTNAENRVPSVENSEKSNTKRKIAKTVDPVNFDANVFHEPANLLPPEWLSNFNEAPAPVLVTATGTTAEEEENISNNETKGVTINEQIRVKANVKRNAKPLSQIAETYELEKFEKNALLIFNHKKIDGYVNPRKGTVADVDALKKTFEKFGFKVKVADDLSKKKIKKQMNDFTSRNFSDYGCVVVAVLTHGSDGGQIRAKDGLYSERTIVNRLQARGRHTLVTKPRIVLIQACRGKKCTKEVPVVIDDAEDDTENISNASYSLPSESDLLVVHSSYGGKAAARHPEQGSWFIQTLCKRIEQYSPVLDLESILVHVKREMAVRETLKYNRASSKDEVFKQMPVSTSTFTRKLYFKKFESATIQSFTDRIELDPSIPDDVPSPVPNTPVRIEFMACTCSLDHFVYIRKCLALYVSQNPSDGFARNLLNIANKLDEDDGAKEETAKAICDLLKGKAKTPSFDCLYFYNHCQNND